MTTIIPVDSTEAKVTLALSGLGPRRRQFPRHESLLTPEQEKLSFPLRTRLLYYRESKVSRRLERMARDVGGIFQISFYGVPLAIVSLPEWPELFSIVYFASMKEWGIFYGYRNNPPFVKNQVRVKFPALPGGTEVGGYGMEANRRAVIGFFAALRAE